MGSDGMRRFNFSRSIFHDAHQKKEKYSWDLDTRVAVRRPTLRRHHHSHRKYGFNPKKMHRLRCSIAVQRSMQLQHALIHILIDTGTYVDANGLRWDATIQFFTAEMHSTQLNRDVDTMHAKRRKNTCETLVSIIHAVWVHLFLGCSFWNENQIYVSRLNG